VHLEPTSTKRHVRRNVVLMVAAVVVAGAVTLGIVLTQGSSQASAQLTSVDNACQQWLSVSPGLGGDDQWCTDMANWMSQYMGRSGVGPQMMWGNAGQMLARCEQWMTSEPPSGTTPSSQGWCSAMVGWMANHMRSWSGQDTWGGWMMNGPMMGVGLDR